MTVLAGAPEGYDAWLIADRAAMAGEAGLLHVAEDGRRLERLRRLLAFRAPERTVLAFPAWDALPYDRASPSTRVTGRRIDTLVRLARPGPKIVLTTAGGLLRRLPPADTLARLSYSLVVGEAVDLEALRLWLLRGGYGPAAEAAVFGDAVWRNDGLDIVSPGVDGPLRLELPGGRLASARTAAGGELERVDLYPATEIVLDDMAIERFKSGYLAAFGGEAEEDPLYRAVDAGRRHAGLEHALPLFFPATDTLFDRLAEAVVTLDEGAVALRDERLEQAARAYEARRALAGAGPVIRPLPPERVFLTADDWDAALQGRTVVTLSPEPGEGGGEALTLGGGDPAERLAGLRREDRRVLVAVSDPARRRALLRSLRRDGVADLEIADDWPAARALPPGTAAVVPFELDGGFQAPGLAVVAAAALLGKAEARPRRGRRLVTDLAVEAADLAPGSLVVHADHGIGVSDGLETLTDSGAPHDCLRVVYKDDAKVYVPVENLDLLWPFGAAGKVPLDRLGGGAWIQRRDKVAGALADAATALVRVQAERAQARVAPIRPPRAGYRRFVDRFPYEETPGQCEAIDAVLGDLASGRLMDRLVCADVGFGKTEVALRAAFAVAMAGRQVAVVAPTTVLCRQHATDARARFAGFGVTVAELSRGVAPAEARAVRKGLADGSVRVVVGTHALLGQGIRFSDLGLLVIDEEQRLGVKQKERLKALSEGCHVLTLTATPIPRTLQLALAGLRELSVIATPPVARRPVRTDLSEWDPARVREALRAERARGGQCFYVCPHVEDLDTVRARIAEIAPDFRVVEAHGQMPADRLDDAMTAFAEGAGDLLLATNIIENGLNIPNANTIVVHRADRFGLAQLHQLRGRVGRGAVQGHCWLTVERDEELSEPARQRLRVLTELDKPGAGFELAAHDLGLRGAGDLLGEEQSGHLRAVGVELFQEMLRQAVEAARAGRPPMPEPVPRLTIGLPVLIPESWIGDATLRLAVYRRLAVIDDADERDAFAADLADRFGPLPPEVETLMELDAFKTLARDAGVETLDIGPAGALLGFREGRAPDAAAFDRLAGRHEGLKARPDGRLVLVAGDREPAAYHRALRRLLRDVAR
ncbi:MAG TPA: DEAD/DEAH box helicase [Azospirillum sp.]|nr:DEAD/DEAH box helicase [Azospirillum sp.]